MENTRPKQAAKAVAFRDMHLAGETFVMPNAWNAGSARLLEAEGFQAIATTSAGIAFSLGLPDYVGALARDDALDETRRIASAVDVPVSMDSENCYGHDPETVAESIAMIAATGAVGGSIEDFSSDYGNEQYPLELSVERVRAASEAARGLDFPFTLTARAECYLVGHPDPFAESVKRCNLYREAGADCLYVPGLRDADTIGALVREVDGPLNVVMGLAGKPLTVRELRDLGVCRISIGGSLARTVMGLVRSAAKEIMDHGTFGYAAGQIPDAELCDFFRSRDRGGE